MTKAGCNAGACHGTPTGKNGFRLSLRGYDPSLDYKSLAREHEGRRIDRLSPAASLVLAKATGMATHEGGKRFDADGELARVIREWVSQGARDDTAAPPIRVEVTPAHVILDEPVTEQALRVTAYFPNGPPVDVTALTRFSVSDETIAGVTDSAIRKRKHGEAAVAAEYMGLMATAVIAFRDPAPGFRWPNPPESNFIDTHVFAKLKELRVEPSGLCTDEEFVRRAHLDAIGRLPTPDRVRAFLADHSPDKRDRLVTELLARDEFADWWAQKWADRLGVNQRFVGKIGAVKYHQWIHEQVAANVPEDEFVRRILTATGGNYSNPPVGFYRRLRDPRLRAEEVSQLFLGVRIGCAKCHNHPGERWTQDDYYSLAAFFERIEYRNGPFFLQIYDKEETVYVTRTGEVSHPRTDQVMAPKFLGGAVPTIPPGKDRRAAFAEWLTAPDNPFFARAAVNRIWYHLFGRGIVDPVDDVRVTNPPSHPALLDALAAEFVRGGYDRKHLIRLVMTSRTYQLSSAPTPTNVDDDRYFSRYPVRRLGAEQLLDAIADATGVPEKYPGQPAGAAASSLPDGEYKHPFLEAFGRPARAMACECERGGDTTLGQALHLVGGRAFDAKVRAATGRVATLVKSGKPDVDILEELFLATLSRPPSVAEREVVGKRLASAGAKGGQSVLEDVLYALLNHDEFLFQH
ncbi:hypothetical protein FRUB_00208 [Fimbriiglobus ruber]|uniref:Translation initiation factor 2 n=1 Tax=Fimbriiglobus ruber TaxID=1908690 RepID=A0A225EAU9_9BACT|nr:hypothetical protein FRUB_00208 [Fimbriiglobus ruber]